MGVITLSDVLRYVIGEVGIGERRREQAPTTTTTGTEQQTETQTPPSSKEPSA
jgi:hypothetical protein